MRASLRSETNGKAMIDQPGDLRLTASADELAITSLETKKLGQLEIQGDFYIPEHPSPDNHFNLLARPAPPPGKRRATDYRPTAYVSMTFAPAPIPEGVIRLLEMRERIDHLMRPVLKQPPPSE